MEKAMAEDAAAVALIDRLPVDILAHIFLFLSSFTDLVQVSSVCRKWREGVKQSLGSREHLSFAGWKMDDDSIACVVAHSYSLKELHISTSNWVCQITDNALHRISLAKCISNLTSISLWGITGITDKGVIQLVSRSPSLQHLNVGGTSITDESLFATANSCQHLKTIILCNCCQVTESGLFFLVQKCHKLESINVWGMRVPVSCFTALLKINPAIKIKPGGVQVIAMFLSPDFS